MTPTAVGNMPITNLTLITPFPNTEHFHSFNPSLDTNMSTLLSLITLEHDRMRSSYC